MVVSSQSQTPVRGSDQYPSQHPISSDHGVRAPCRITAVTCTRRELVVDVVVVEVDVEVVDWRGGIRRLDISLGVEQYGGYVGYRA